jgi:hypothetical protein
MGAAGTRNRGPKVIVNKVQRRLGIGRPRVRSGMPRGVPLFALTAIVLAATASLALAEETSRSEYKAAAEPICKANAEANDHILKGVRTKVRQGKLAVAGGQFVRAATALRKTLRQLTALPRPEADAERLGEWLERVGDEADLLQQVGEALKVGNRRRAESLSAKLVSGARLTNAIVVPFGFQYCRFEPSKYT